MIRGVLVAVVAGMVFAGPAPAQSPSQDLEVARGVLEKALVEHPANAELHTLLGFVFRKMNKIEDAEKSFASAVEHNPLKAEAHYMLGMIREKRGELDKAKASWKACIEAGGETGMRETARRHLAVLEKKAR